MTLSGAGWRRGDGDGVGDRRRRPTSPRPADDEASPAGARAETADEGVVLTETQVATPERKRDDEEASRAIETAHPGYLGAQTTAALPAVGC